MPYLRLGSKLLTAVRLLLLFWYLTAVSGSCAASNNCNGHGVCGLHSKCDCFDGWGSKNDVTTYRAPDCSARACPSGSSWGDLPTRNGTAHHEAECSDKGICDRATGKCKCAPGFEGAACQRLKCPNNCSGHGTCVTMERLATKREALPLSDTTSSYTDQSSTTAWDSQKIVACLCESSWPVGLRANETQEPEWFGPDCSLRHCPSADNPRTVLNETDCSQQGRGHVAGEYGNLCQVDCAHQGVCDHHSGTCSCFAGQYGTDCSLQLEVPLKDYYNEDGIYGGGGSSSISSSSGDASIDYFAPDAADWAGEAGAL